MDSDGIIDSAQEALRIVLEALTAGWDWSKPYLHDGAQWLADWLS